VQARRESTEMGNPSHDQRFHPELEVIEPNLPIVDCHHHLWHPHAHRYLIDAFAADIAAGHTVLATVYVECGAMYRRRGPEAFRPVGEAEFAAGMAAMSDSGLFGPTRICAGFSARPT
jgi:L-fuconolactonase